jgi:hypothetical protein
VVRYYLASDLVITGTSGTYIDLSGFTLPLVGGGWKLGFHLRTKRSSSSLAAVFVRLACDPALFSGVTTGEPFGVVLMEGANSHLTASAVSPVIVTNAAGRSSATDGAGHQAAGLSLPPVVASGNLKLQVATSGGSPHTLTVRAGSYIEAEKIHDA